jgi:hypothetical protein
MGTPSLISYGFERLGRTRKEKNLETFQGQIRGGSMSAISPAQDGNGFHN